MKTPTVPRLSNALLPAVLAAVGASFVLSACGGGDDAPTGSTLPIESTGLAVQQNAFDAKLKGSWRVLGEGRLVEVNDSGIHQFQEVKALCYPDRQVLPSAALEGFTYRHLKTSDHKVTIDLYATPGAPSGYTLEAIDGIPSACRKAPPTDAVTVFQTMWDTFDLHYGFFKERHIDWAARYAALRPRLTPATNTEALQTVLVDALHDFNDEHVSLIRYDGDEPVFAFDAGNGPTLKALLEAFAGQSEIASLDEFATAWQQGMQAATQARLTGGSAGRVLNGAMVWGRLPGNIGYIEMSRMDGFSEAGAHTASDLRLVRAELDRAIAALADTKAMIVDVAVNGGGFDVVSAEVAGRFADSRRPAFTVQQHRPQGRPNQDWFVEPKGPQQYVKPVYLLTTDRTISAGDVLALMMRVLPHVTQIGQATSGSISIMQEKSLPGAFAVNLPNESRFDPNGVLYEGLGVPPKVALQVFDPSNLASLASGHGAAIDQIVRLIGQQPAATPTPGR